MLYKARVSTNPAASASLAAARLRVAAHGTVNKARQATRNRIKRAAGEPVDLAKLDLRHVHALTRRGWVEKAGDWTVRATAEGMRCG